MDDREVVIVTGASGFIGSALIRRLFPKYGCIGFDRNVPPDPPAEAECVCTDLTSDESVAEAVRRVRTAYGTRIASVVHLAAYFDLTGKPNPQYEQVTVRGTERLLYALRKSLKIEQFIFFSTMLVHAPTRRGQRIDEDSPLDPQFPYRESKIRTERVIHEARGTVPTVILRPAGVYDDQCHSAFLSQQIMRIYERKLTSHVYPGPLDTGQPFLHLDDLIDAILRIIKRRRELPAETQYLLGEAESIAFGDLQEMIGCLLYGEEWTTRSLPPALAKAAVKLQDEVLEEESFIRPWMVKISRDHYEIDASRAREQLGWKPRHSLRATLPRMIAALNCYLRMDALLSPVEKESVA